MEEAAKKLTKEEKAAKKAKKEAKAAKRARESTDADPPARPRVSPRLAATPAAADLPELSLATDAPAKKPKKEKAEKKDTEAKKEKAAKKEKRKLDAAADAPSKKPKQDKAEKKEKASEEVAAIFSAAAPPKRVSPRLQAAAVPAAAMPELSLDSSAAAGGTQLLSADAYRKEHSITGSGPLPDPVQSFATSPFDARIKATLAAAGFKSPSPIQAQARGAAFK